ncbi:xylulokinase [Bacillaceae bacterium SIJ1]|uniref:xylulokinase n=1 Tax=Litoribacterium kuwaitense TaxID=1398745 RepID=UPI0013E9FEFE|nr:xylulokinase [Litoribacterium kuwaitense]NGP46140.1 xylulokinase [Litoribacterium kuwaitense]
MSYVAGIDLGTSAVKVVVIDQNGTLVCESSVSLDMEVAPGGVREQHPDTWVAATVSALKQLVADDPKIANQIEGISFSGQMHGLVLLDENYEVLRPAILWNDTRTHQECAEIRETLGAKLYKYTKNPALEGFTLPKLLWVRKHERALFERAQLFLLPKDYVRYHLTGMLHTEPSDAAGTLLFNPVQEQWSEEMLDAFQLPKHLCPDIVHSTAEVGVLKKDIAENVGLTREVRVFAGGADNACGAVGTGIIAEGETLCSIGTSGVLLSYEEEDVNIDGGVHFFNHAKPGAYYTMGVTLAAGFSMKWAKDILAPNESFDELLAGIDDLPPGSGGLLFTPYLNGERTPYSDASIRASWIGLDAEHTRTHMAKAVMEGITFSLNESLSLFRQAGKTITTIISTGGGAKNRHWLQMQADIFNVKVISLEHEEGPGFGAAMIAAAGCGWDQDLDSIVKKFVKRKQEFHPNKANVEAYEQLYQLYRQVYRHTEGISRQLTTFRH